VQTESKSYRILVSHNRVQHSETITPQIQYECNTVKLSHPKVSRSATQWNYHTPNSVWVQHSETITPQCQYRPSLRKDRNPGPLRSLYKECRNVLFSTIAAVLRTAFWWTPGSHGSRTPPITHYKVYSDRHPWCSHTPLPGYTSSYFMCVNTRVYTQVLWQVTLCRWVNTSRRFKGMAVSPKCHKYLPKEKALGFGYSAALQAFWEPQI
jgi:hypothetical protein